jgi:CRISPR-associated protein Cmr1
MLLATLDLFLLLGGIGARWRRGFGSLWPANENGFADPIAGAGMEEHAHWFGRRVGAAIGRLRRPGPVSAASAAAPPGVRRLRSGAARLYLVEPAEGAWITWDDAMDHLRDDFYRPLKAKLGVGAIGSARRGAREPSPLVIQIKPSAGGFVGVALVFAAPLWGDSRGPWSAWDGAFGSGFADLQLVEVDLPS